VEHVEQVKRESAPTHAANANPNARGNVFFASEVAAVEAVFDPRVNALILARTSDASSREEAFAYAASSQVARTSIFVVPVDEQGEVRLAPSELAAFPRVRGRIVELAEIVAELTGSRAIGVRIAVLSAPMCPALHVDRVTLRAVVTLLGEGTHVARADHGGEAIVVVPTGAIAFLKGEAWPGNEGRAARHRSPLEAAGLRVVVTADPLA
jgi:hypothetical protein